DRVIAVAARERVVRRPADQRVVGRAALEVDRAGVARGAGGDRDVEPGRGRQLIRAALAVEDELGDAGEGLRLAVAGPVDGDRAGAAREADGVRVRGAVEGQDLPAGRVGREGDRAGRPCVVAGRAHRGGPARMVRVVEDRDVDLVILLDAEEQQVDLAGD